VSKPKSENIPSDVSEELTALDAEVEKVFDSLPADLVDDWLECLEAAGFEIRDTARFKLAFRLAAHVVLRELGRSSYPLRKQHGHGHRRAPR
jgi:hypothetical protein